MTQRAGTTLKRQKVCTGSIVHGQTVISTYRCSGFRKNFSTKTAVTFFVDEIRRNMDNGPLTGAVFIDLKKAFDTIDHHILLNKLQRYGICNRTLLWFSSHLLGRSQRVEVDKALSSPLDITSGVPQGSILGPLLFILYINDMPSRICFSQSLLYADDSVLFFYR